MLQLTLMLMMTQCYQLTKLSQCLFVCHILYDQICSANSLIYSTTNHVVQCTVADAIYSDDIIAAYVE